MRNVLKNFDDEMLQIASRVHGAEWAHKCGERIFLKKLGTKHVFVQQRT